MKKKMIVLLMAACMALTACGGSKKDKELDSELAALREEMESEMSEDELEAVEEERAALQEEMESETTEEVEEEEEDAAEFTMDPVMATTNWGDCIIQVDDMVIDYYNAQFKDIFPMFEEKGRYTFYDRSGLSSNGHEYFSVKKDGENVIYIYCRNPSEMPVTIEDSVVTCMSMWVGDGWNKVAPHKTIWLPTGLCVDSKMTRDELLAYLEETNASEYCDIEERGNNIVMIRRENGERYNNEGLCFTVEYDFEFEEDGSYKQFYTSDQLYTSRHVLVGDINEMLNQ